MKNAIQKEDGLNFLNDDLSRAICNKIISNSTFIYHQKDAEKYLNLLNECKKEIRRLTSEICLKSSNGDFMAELASNSREIDIKIRWAIAALGILANYHYDEHAQEVLHEGLVYAIKGLEALQTRAFME